MTDSPDNGVPQRKEVLGPRIDLGSWPAGIPYPKRQTEPEATKQTAKSFDPNNWPDMLTEPTVHVSIDTFPGQFAALPRFTRHRSGDVKTQRVLVDRQLVGFFDESGNVVATLYYSNPAHWPI